jgi:adenylate cyclase
VAVDWEAEGLLNGVVGETARAARIRLLDELLADGLPLDELRRAAAEGRLALLPAERVMGRGGRGYTPQEVAERTGLGLELLDRLRRAMGLPVPRPGERALGEGDLDAARAAARLLEAGIPEERFLDLTRVMSRAMAAVAAAIVRTFGEAFIRAGDTERDAGLRYAEASRELGPLALPALQQMLILHVREELGRAMLGQAELASGRLPGGQPICVCFADLVGFTMLGERLPPEELGVVAGRLERMATEVAEPPVRLLKTIGDAALLVSADADALLAAALDLVQAGDAAGEGFPRMRAGLAYGAALPRGGDWYGRPVNLASRLTGLGRPGSVVATEEVRENVDEDRYAWSFAGRQRLKGVQEEVVVFRVRRREAERQAP